MVSIEKQVAIEKLVAKPNSSRAARAARELSRKQQDPASGSADSTDVEENVVSLDKRQRKNNSKWGDR